ncbi:hypothetical protein ONS95_006337 [Cadophora gregata]|uniref:uncharacterized protein n=1 Tax=Cadophora gregata TaxID=51156 RepID=UPI0026DB91AC|nr:uncharacterized protein ONS95_006337 [Cadophora gregata]KAK0099297.1 hypothetical protein ONS96_008528 [Cadophora gregata f. sp. sojae]KAK0102739.1 hypothetical protein ONS95_006337 [Cadophora gregata]
MEFWIWILLLSSSSISISADSIFRRQECAVPCAGACGLVGDTCCTTPSGRQNLCGYGTSCCFEGCCNYGSTCQPDGTCLPAPADPGPVPPRPGSPGTSQPGTVPVFTIITNPDGTVTTSVIGVPGGAPGGPGPGLSTITSPHGTVVTSTFGVPGSEPGSPGPALTTDTNPDRSTATSTVSIPDGAPGIPGPILTTITNVDGSVTTSTVILPDQMVVTSSAGQLFWGTFVVPVPADLSTASVVTTNGETFTFMPASTRTFPPLLSTTSSTTKEALVTYTSWPDIVRILPITTDVPSPKNDDGKPTNPCKTWFFFVCISFNLPKLNIQGWAFPKLPTEVYPPGPPPGLKFPPGFKIEGKLPPWPRLTIGPDGVPSYSEEPTSCETSSATLFITTSSFGVNDARTTATQVLSTSNVIVGCDITDSTSMTTTTSACPATATDCGGYLQCFDVSSDPAPENFENDSSPLATSVFNYVNSIWSFLDAEGFTTMSTVTVIPYALQGTAETTSNSCITLRRNAPSGVDYSYQFFDDGGRNPNKSCSASTFNDPASFRIRNGFCTLHTGEDCTGDTQGIDSHRRTGCTDISSDKFLPKTWGSMSCFAVPN